jgi:hypothetical protein
MDQHIKALGVINIVYGLVVGVPVTLFGILIMVFGTTLFGASFSAEAEKGGLIIGGVVAFIIGMLVLVMAIYTFLSVVVGWGLLKHKSWARMVALGLAALHILSGVGSLLSVGGAVASPLFIGLAVYTLWVLLSQEATSIFEKRTY